MLNIYLVRERQLALLAEAEAARRAARPRRGGRVTLRDGSQVLIRRVRGSDAPLLADGFTRLSAESRWLRFLTTKTELSAAELRYLTEVDHRDHEALGALSHADGRESSLVEYEITLS
jgi:hypothetical protein